MVQIGFSLFVISIAYDTICGERESGTLALVASNPVSKYHILIGKYLGGMASLLAPLAIGWIAAAILINADLVIEFHIAQWSRFGLLFAASGLYLSVFFLLQCWFQRSPVGRRAPWSGCYSYGFCLCSSSQTVPCMSQSRFDPYLPKPWLT